MKITLTQPEIEQAVREFVGKGVSLNTNTQMSVEFSMGRGENGLTAAIDVPYMGVASLPVTPTTAPTTANVAAPMAQSIPAVIVQATDPTTADAPAPGYVEDAPATDAAAAPATGRSLFASTPAT